MSRRALCHSGDSGNTAHTARAQILQRLQSPHPQLLLSTASCNPALLSGLYLKHATCTTTQLQLQQSASSSSSAHHEHEAAHDVAQRHGDEVLEDELAEGQLSAQRNAQRDQEPAASSSSSKETQSAAV